MSKIDRATTLCLACSSSLPPLSKSLSIFTTDCCKRPICPACIASNPRLARYNPCLACLGGVGVIGKEKGKGRVELTRSVNVDGAVRDEDTFVVGDDEDDDASDGEEEGSGLGPPPPYESSSEPSQQSKPTIEEPADDPSPQAISTSLSNPYKYYLKPNDNLKGIALRFNVNGRELCHLNNLPPSTLSTTPHILHTRAYIMLPPSARFKSGSNDPLIESAGPSNPNKDHERARERERAERRLQTLTKEVDWRVAKAYVALADDADLGVDNLMGDDNKGKEGGELRKRRSGQGLGGRAVDRYLDDEEWEAREEREGRKVDIQPFPYFGGGDGKGVIGGFSNKGKGKSILGLGPSLWGWKV